MFSMGCLLGAPAGVNSRPWYPWRGITVFLRFYKGFGLTVRFPGVRFFGSRRNARFPNGFEAFWVRAFFLAGLCR